MALPKPFALNAVVWNPLSANTEERLLDIVEETCNFDIVILPGTCVRAPKTGDTKILQHNKATCIAAGYGTSKSVNQSCGCSIIIGKTIQQGTFLGTRNPTKTPSGERTGSTYFCEKG